MTHLEKNVASEGSATTNLRRLLILRVISVAGQLLVMRTAWTWLQVALPFAPMLLIISGLCCFNLVSWFRLKHAKQVSDFELLTQVLADIAALTLLLYFSGGATNPFISLYLLPLAISAVLLPRLYAGLLTLVTVACYTALMFVFQPLNYAHRMTATGHDRLPAIPFGMHIVGMWLTFGLSAALILFFVSTMARTIRERDRLLAQAREETLRNERIIALGTLAAGAAHELGTPLSTMAVLVREMELEAASFPELADDLHIVGEQVARCKHILTNLLATSGQTRSEDLHPLAVDVFLQEVVDKWQVIRPEITLRTHLQGTRPAPSIIADQTLGQALMNLLNNAADASPESVEVAAQWDRQALEIRIHDRGAGFSAETLARAGKLFFTTKRESGMGLGLFLSNATINRFGGEVSHANRPEGGVCTFIRIPVESLKGAP